MPKNDGGPAFPYLPTQDRHEKTKGMTLRDWFAGMAMSSVLNAALSSCPLDDDVLSPDECDDYALSAYSVADAMLKARDK